jgi:hypothetical protein
MQEKPVFENRCEDFRSLIIEILYVRSASLCQGRFYEKIMNFGVNQIYKYIIFYI